MTHAARISDEPIVDLVDELRLRRWARENYVPVNFRDQSWDDFVLEEMRRRDQELTAADDYLGIAQRIVPLVTEHGPALRGPHRDVVRAQVLARVPFVE